MLAPIARAAFTSETSTGTSTRGPTTAENASPDARPKVATATAMASSMLLPAAVKAMEVQYDPADPDGYETLDDYLHDHGLRILQEAIRLCAQRHLANH